MQAVPRIRTATRSFVILCHNRTNIQRPPLAPHVRHYQYQPIATHALLSKGRYLRRGITALAFVSALYGLYRLYDESRPQFRPSYFFLYCHLKRAIARDVNMEDLNDAMDYFLRVFGTASILPLGLDEVQPRLVKFRLKFACHLAQEHGPEVTAGLLDLVKEACSKIRSFKVTNSYAEEAIHRELRLLYMLLYEYRDAFMSYTTEQVPDWRARLVRYGVTEDRDIR